MVERLSIFEHYPRNSEAYLRSRLLGNISGGSKYNLTIGAAYLIAILAVQNGTGDASMLTSNIELDNIRTGLTTRLFPLQGVEDARRGARALYFLFRFLFTPNPKHGDGKSTCCTSFNFLDAGHTMAFGLSWPSGSRKSLADEVADKLPLGVQEDSSPDGHLERLKERGSELADWKEYVQISQ